MYNGDGHEVEGTRYLYTYILPPIRYPNGNDECGFVTMLILDLVVIYSCLRDVDTVPG